MPTDVVMPQMGESITEGTITKWLKRPGESVERDEPLFEISTDKVDAEIPSPSAGVLQEIKVPEGSTVGINTVVCTLGEGGVSNTVQPAPAQASPAETAGAPAIDSAEPAAIDRTGAVNDYPAAVPGTSEAPMGVAADAQSKTTAGSAEEDGSSIDVLMPQMGESITEGTITKWLKSVGDTVQRDEPLFEISTDKVDAEIPSPASGRLLEVRVEAGKTIGINAVVARISSGAARQQPASSSAQKGASVPQAAPAAQQSAKPAAVAPDAGQSAGQRSSPLVRKIAADNKVDLANVSGTGASGRITKEDIQGYLAGGGPAKAESAATPSTTGLAKPAPTYTQAESAKATTAPQQAATVTPPQPGELVAMSKMRSIIAKRMVESKATSAHVHTVFKVDMTRIVRLREKEKSKYEQRNGVKLTYMPFITRAAVQALRKHAIVNASTQGESILYNRNINIGIAVALEWGLIVPVIKQAEEKSFLGIARSIVDVADRARNKKLAPDEVAGGTFTLTNSGIFGEQFGTPIIAQPQSAILGIGGLNKEAVVLTDKDGQDTIAVRSIQRFTLGFDHRIIDGSDAGKFMTDFKNYLENWTEDLG